MIGQVFLGQREGFPRHDALAVLQFANSINQDELHANNLPFQLDPAKRQAAPG